ncbi:unnamed protein product [Phytophthora fragariaefolia]|uniref:Unnamed protein product n=1 Tax=Phytophthora fragariaefolia TaxID=1490495 RepID=A0A9W6XIV8_9STRA|nr:unnamed protein product [Phytophthora fragariaefolia]
MATSGGSSDNTGLHRVNSSPKHELLSKLGVSRPPDVTDNENEGHGAPEAKVLPSTGKMGVVPRPTGRQIAVALYHWTTCLFICVLILSQFLGIF